MACERVKPTYIMLLHAAGNKVSLNLFHKFIEISKD